MGKEMVGVECGLLRPIESVTGHSDLDIAGLCDINRHNIARWECGLRDGLHLLYRVIDQEKAMLLGVAGITNMWRFPEVHVLIATEHRRRGVGTGVLQELMASYVALAGGKRMALPVSACVAEVDIAQERLFQKAGFRRMEVPVAYERLVELGDPVAKWRWEWRAVM